MPVKTLFVMAKQFGDVEDELIGDGVRVVRLPDRIREQMFQQNTLRVARWDFDSGYNHAIQNIYDPAKMSDEEAEQEIIRAMLILRIVEPSSAGLHLVGTAEQAGDGDPQFFLMSRVGIGSIAYVGKSYLYTRISREHVRRARVLWPNIQLVCRSWNYHRRILQAVRYYEAGCTNFSAEIRHILFHSALEILLCTSRKYLGQQIRQRVVAISRKVKVSDLRTITQMRGGFVHSGAIVNAARGREDELIEKLERIIRVCLYHVLADPESVDIFSDPRKIRKAFPVEIRDEKTGKKIVL